MTAPADDDATADTAPSSDARQADTRPGDAPAGERALDDASLGDALADLAGHLDHPAGDGLGDHVVALLAGGAGVPGATPEGTADEDRPGRSAAAARDAAARERHDDGRSTGPGSQTAPVATTPEARPGPGPRRALLLGAAVVVTVGGLAAFPPTRETIGSWFGVGPVRVTKVPGPWIQAPAGPGTGAAPPATTGSSGAAGGPATAGTSDSVPAPGQPGGPAQTGVAGALADARRRASFVIRETDAGILQAVTVDDRVPGALVVLDYGEFAVVQVSSPQFEDAPVLGRIAAVDGNSIEPASVLGGSAYWVSGAPREIGFVDRAGTLRRDPVHKAGDVLIWQVRGVTYRVEGSTSLAAAQRIAESLR